MVCSIYVVIRVGQKSIIKYTLSVKFVYLVIPTAARMRGHKHTLYVYLFASFIYRHLYTNSWEDLIVQIR